MRPMGTPDAPSFIKKAEKADKTEPINGPPPGGVSKIAPATRAASVIVIDARSGEIIYEKRSLQSEVLDADKIDLHGLPFVARNIKRELFVTGRGVNVRVCCQRRQNCAG